MTLVFHVINFDVLDKRTAKYAKDAKKEIRRKNTPKLMTRTISHRYTKRTHPKKNWKWRQR